MGSEHSRSLSGKDLRIGIEGVNVIGVAVDKYNRPSVCRTVLQIAYPQKLGIDESGRILRHHHLKGMLLTQMPCSRVAIAYLRST